MERGRHLGLRPPPPDPDCELSKPPHPPTPVGPRPHFPQLDPFPNVTSFCRPSSEEQVSGRQKTGDPFMVNLAVMSAAQLVSLTHLPPSIIDSFFQGIRSWPVSFFASQSRRAKRLKNVRRVLLRRGRCVSRVSDFTL